MIHLIVSGKETRKCKGPEVGMSLGCSRNSKISETHVKSAVGKDAVRSQTGKGQTVEGLCLIVT